MKDTERERGPEFLSFIIFTLDRDLERERERVREGGETRVFIFYNFTHVFISGLH